MTGLPAPVAGAVAQTVGTAATQAAVPASPVAGDVARFQSAMAGGSPADDMPGSVPVGSAPSGADGVRAADAPGLDSMAHPSPVVAAPSTPGDAILRGLQRMNGGFHTSLDNVAKTLGNIQPGQPMNSADLMRAQLALTQVTVQQDLTSKVVGKVTSNLDTFLKNG